MKKIGTEKRKTVNGYLQEITLYQAQKCYGCPLRVNCHKQKRYNLRGIKKVNMETGLIAIAHNLSKIAA